MSRFVFRSCAVSLGVATALWAGCVQGELSGGSDGGAADHDTRSGPFDTGPPTGGGDAGPDVRDTSRGELPGDGGNGDSTVDGGEVVDDATGPTLSCTVPTSPGSSTVAVTIEWSADDSFEGWLDGTKVDSSGQWDRVTTVDRTLDTGVHVIAVRGKDSAGVYSGFIGRVTADGAAPDCLQTGPNSAWRVRTSSPQSGWRTSSSSGANWSAPTAAADVCTSTWNQQVQVPDASWVWEAACEESSSDWHDTNWYRLAFEVRSN